MNESSSGGFFAFIIWIAIYAYAAYAIQTLAKKTNTPNAWFAWVPFLNIYLMLKIAGKPGWWFILLLIPFINIIISIIVWMRIAEIRNYPSWYGILFIIPFVNLIVLGMFAFSDKNAAVPQPTITA